MIENLSFRAGTLLLLCGVLLLCPHLLGQRANTSSWQRASSLLDSAQELHKEARYREATALIKLAEAAIESNAPDSLSFKYQLTLARNYLKLRNIPAAQTALAEAEKWAMRQGDSLMKAEVYTELGYAYFVKNQFDTALGLYQQAWSYRPEAKQDYMLLSRMAQAYSGLNQYDQALSKFLEAREHFVASGDRQQQAVVENNIGELYRVHLNDHNAAKAHYLSAIKVNEAEGQRQGLAYNYHNMALIYLAAEHIDSAALFCSKALELRIEMGDSGGLAPEYYLLGRIYHEQGSNGRAIASFQKSLAITERFEIMEGVFHNHLNLGRVYLEAGSYRQAESHLERARKLADQAGKLEMVQAVNFGFYKLNKARGHFATALSYHERLKELGDSMREAKSEQSLAALRVEYETDLAAAENRALRETKLAQAQRLQSQDRLLYLALISIFGLLLVGFFLWRLLRQRNRAYDNLRKAKQERDHQYAQLKQREEELAITNEFKNNILSVLGHDLRSPLASISALLGSISAEGITRAELEDLFSHLKRENDVSLETLQEILVWSRLQMDESGQQLRSLDPGSLLQSVTMIYEPHLRAKNLSLKVEIEEGQKLWGDKNQLRSIVGNLLSNAIKFSPAGASITISVKGTADHHSRLCISDEGAGISPEVLDNLNSRNRLLSNSGTRGEPGSGIGLRIVKDFVDAHQGELYFENNPAGGANVVVLLPKERQLSEMV